MISKLKTKSNYDKKMTSNFLKCKHIIKEFNFHIKTLKENFPKT